MKKNPLYKPMVLIILDGWGITPTWSGNAISSAHPRHFDYYWRNFPHLVLQAFSKIATKSQTIPDPGIGHTILGTGRLIYPQSTQVSNQIDSGEFFQNQTLNKIVNYNFQTENNIHLIGMLSSAGQLAEMEHLESLLIFFKNKGVKNVYLHGILDGRDIKPSSGIGEIDYIEQKIKQLEYGSLVTLMGRSWILDNETDNSKLQRTIYTLISSKASVAKSSIEIIKKKYQEGIPDFSFPPTIIMRKDPIKTRIKSDDIIILFDFLGDNLNKFIEKILPHNKQIFSLTKYQNVNVQPIITTGGIKNSLSEVISNENLKQIKITETYRQNEIGFYFNGFREKKFPQEKRLIIESVLKMNEENYPQLRLYDIISNTISKINKSNYDFILVDIPNADILARTGNILACQKTINYIDEALSIIVEAVLKKSGCAIISAGYGNAENMTKTIASSLNPVPFILINLDNKIEHPNDFSQIIDQGSLVSQMIRTEFTTADVAPTILELLGIDKPTEMTGKSLLSVLRPTFTKTQ